VREEEVGIGVRIGVGGVGEVGGGGRRWRGGAAANLTVRMSRMSVWCWLVAAGCFWKSPCRIARNCIVQRHVHPVRDVRFQDVLRLPQLVQVEDTALY
jgi:hypothetical protein